MPYLALSPAGGVYLSWIDTLGEQGHALRFARWDGSKWGPAETISEGRNWFVNWADFPSLTVAADGTMLAHWLAKPDIAGNYGYGIRVAQRKSEGSGAWRQIAAFNENDPVDYAGFLSFAGSRAAYLSPPKATRAAAQHHSHGEGEEHIKTLRLAEFGKDGQLVSDVELDGDVCSCCQTASALTPSGMLVAYRDHLPGEIRDISLIRIKDGKASSPAVLHRDGWKINGCPTEGPTISAVGHSVAVAWMTRAGEVPRVRLAWSVDGGATFRPPTTVDDGNPLGRPHLAPVDEEQSVLVWLEKTRDGAEIRLRRVFRNGVAAQATRVAKVAAARSTGLPMVAVHGSQVLVAWRDGVVLAGWLPLASLPRETSVKNPLR